jgi:hypothetical protein
MNEQSNNNVGKTNVRVKYPSGGQSNISLGSDNINYNDYKKNL